MEHGQRHRTEGLENRILKLSVPVLASLCIGCSEVPSEIPLDEPVESLYTLAVRPAAVPGTTQNAGDTVQTYEGVKTLWRPAIGHMELGPEESGSGPLASLWMDVTPQSCFNFETGEVDPECDPSFFFYQIGKPEGNLGAQEAYSYTQSGKSVFHFAGTGVDSNGVPFFVGIVDVPFTINAPAIGELPLGVQREIVVTAEFSALDN